LKQIATLKEGRHIVFSYSYTARRAFEFARAQGWPTVLMEIDCGPLNVKLLEALKARHPGQESMLGPAPPEYWVGWKRELELADVIIANSEWTRASLLEQGVDSTRLSVVPLAYERAPAPGFKREYPAEFTPRRPLRVLYLGKISLLKGAGEALEAMRTLREAPVELLMVGPEVMNISEEYRRFPNIRWIGPVPRDMVDGHYRNADVFLFPTFSDGFGLTQLEAQSWQLPIISSIFCANVVRDGHNGVVLKEVSAAVISKALSDCCHAPSRLAEFSQNAVDLADYSLQKLAERLQAAVEPALREQ